MTKRSCVACGDVKDVSLMSPVTNGVNRRYACDGYFSRSCVEEAKVKLGFLNRVYCSGCGEHKLPSEVSEVEDGIYACRSFFSTCKGEVKKNIESRKQPAVDETSHTVEDTANDRPMTESEKFRSEHGFFMRIIVGPVLMSMITFYALFYWWVEASAQQGTTTALWLFWLVINIKMSYFDKRLVK